MTSFHHPLSPLVLLVLLLPLIILRGRYRPDHVELEHQIPITRQSDGNRLQDGPCQLRKNKTKKKKSQNSLPFYNANRIKHPKNGFPSSLARINARKGKKRKENDQFTSKNRSSDREIDAIILSHCVFPTILRFAYSAENALFPTWLRHSKPNCRYLPRTCCPVEKRDASAWTAATPAIFDKEWRGRCRYGDTRRPRGAARGSLPESASPATSPSFLGITS